MKKMEDFYEGNEYQLQVMQVVMKVWEEKMLKANDWRLFYPMIFELGIGELCVVKLLIGDGMTEDDIAKFRELCKETFGEDCPPSRCEVRSHHDNLSGRNDAFRGCR